MSMNGEGGGEGGDGRRGRGDRRGRGGQREGKCEWVVSIERTERERCRQSISLC